MASRVDLFAALTDPGLPPDVAKEIVIETTFRNRGDELLEIFPGAARPASERPDAVNWVVRVRPGEGAFENPLGERQRDPTLDLLRLKPRTTSIPFGPNFYPQFRKRVGPGDALTFPFRCFWFPRSVNSPTFVEMALRGIVYDDELDDFVDAPLVERAPSSVLILGATAKEVARETKTGRNLEKLSFIHFDVPGIYELALSYRQTPDRIFEGSRIECDAAPLRLDVP